MFVYGVAVAANQATSGTPNTEVDGLALIAGTGRAMLVQALFVMGKAAALTALSGIAFRLRRFTTASTAGSAITPAPRDPGAQASKCSAASGPTAGSGGAANQLAIGCGAGSPGGWVAANQDSMPLLESGSSDSFDVFNASGTASLNYEQSAEVCE